MTDITTNPATSLAGNTTVDDTIGFEPERLSYLCAGRVASAIATAVQGDLDGRKVVIVSDAALSDIASLSSESLLLDELKDEFENLTLVDPVVDGGSTDRQYAIQFAGYVGGKGQAFQHYYQYVHALADQLVEARWNEIKMLPCLTRHSGRHEHGPAFGC